MSPSPLKEPLRAALIASLRAELEATEAAWRSAVAGATDEEARPENDKDTRALELSYLARGQAARVVELRESLEAVSVMALGDLRGGPAGVGAHVTLEDGRGALSAVLLVARGGGVTLPGRGARGVRRLAARRGPGGQARVRRGGGAARPGAGELRRAVGAVVRSRRRAAAAASAGSRRASPRPPAAEASAAASAG
jgi:hypothetical protein